LRNKEQKTHLKLHEYDDDDDDNDGGEMAVSTPDVTNSVSLPFCSFMQDIFFLLDTMQYVWQSMCVTTSLLEPSIV
jgi:hypothetical protein